MSTTTLLHSGTARARLAELVFFRITVYEYERLTTELDNPRVDLIDNRTRVVQIAVDSISP